MKKLPAMRELLATAALAAFAGASAPASADATAAYTAGATSLADGKIAFDYDGSGGITRLTMAPGDGETLTMSGDILPFADGAQIAFPALYGGGRVVIANPVSTAGALAFSGPTNMTWGGGDYLPNGDTYVTILENVSLDDIAPVEGYGMDGSGAPTFGADNNRYTPFFIVRDGDKMRFELRHGTRYVFVELAQDGADVKGRVLLSGRGGTVSEDSPIFNYDNGEVTVNGEVNTTYKPYYYEKQKWLTFSPRYGTPGLVFAVSEDRTLPAISGCGVEVTFDSNAFGESAQAYTSGTLRCSSSWMTLTSEHALAEITLQAGCLCGSYIEGSDPDGLPAIAFGWTNDGTDASCQLQQLSGNLIRAVDIELRQNGDAVEIRWAKALYTYTNASSFYGKKKVTASDDGVTSNRSYDKIGVLWVSGVLSDIAGTVTLTASGRNDLDGAFVVRGDATHPIVYDVAARYAMPRNIDCYGSATLNFSATGAYNDGASRGTDAVTMHSGTVLTTSGTYPFHHASGDVVLDDATLSYTTGTTYLNYLTLVNGAAVAKTGGAIQAGFQADTPRWTVSGSGCASYTGDIVLVAKGKHAGGEANDLTFEVADTVAGAGTDFLLAGNVTVNNDRPNSTIVKTGLGTMAVDGTLYTTNRAVRVQEGTLLLAKSGATAAGVCLSLGGGTLVLANGTSNEAGEIALSADSSISVGPGASLEVSSMSIPEGATLFISLPNDGYRGVKVKSALDADTLSRIRINGHRASQLAAGGGRGYLYIPGLVFSIH